MPPSLLLSHRHPPRLDEYEPIGDDDTESVYSFYSSSKYHSNPLRRERRTTCRLLLTCLAVVVVVVVGVSKLTATHRQPTLSGKTPEEEVIPTFLSLRHPETKQHVNALKNDVFEQHTASLFSLLHRKPEFSKLTVTITPPELHLDRTEMEVRGALTLSWTTGSDAAGKPVLRDNDLLVLQCGSGIKNDDNYSADDEPEDTTILEVATMAHVQATSAATHRRTAATGTTAMTIQQWHFEAFPVVRHDACQFVLYRIDDSDDNLTFSWHRLAQSPWVHIRQAHSRPTAIHWAVTAQDPTHMVVQFVTGGSTGTPVVQYAPVSTTTTNDVAVGRHHHQAPKKVTGTTDTYGASDLCEAPANQTAVGQFQPPGKLHTVRLTELVPDTDYEYQVGLTGGQGVTWSDRYIMRSPPALSNSTTTATTSQPFAYLVYGDQGCPSNGWGEGSLWTTALAAREIHNASTSHAKIRAVHHLGDLAYAKGAAHIWDEWLAMIQPITTAVPFMVAVGNHEYDYTHNYAQSGLDGSGSVAPYQPVWGNFYNDSGGECGVPVAKRFAMPSSSNNSNSVFWYSYDMGPVHTTVVSSEHDLSPGSAQYAWLQEDLQSVDRSRTPWLVVESHRPMYQAEALWGNNAVGIAMRLEFEDLLYDYDVDLFLAGHYHSYFRTCDGLYRSRCHSEGPMHITVGTAGANLEMTGLYWNWWSARHISGVYGYGRITVVNATALHFEFVKAGDANDTSAGDTLDDVWVIRDR